MIRADVCAPQLGDEGVYFDRPGKPGVSRPSNRRTSPLDTSSLDNEAKPHADTSLDPESLDEPPTSNQYYLYSRIDGDQTVDELCRTSGLGREATLKALEALHSLGLIAIPGHEPTSSTASEPTDSPEPGDERPTERREEDERDESDGTADGRTDEATASALNESTAPLEDRGADEETDEGAENKQRNQSRSSAGSSAGGIDFSGLPVPPGEIEVSSELLEMDVDLEVPFRRELVALSRQLDDINYYEFYGIAPDADAGEIKKSYFSLSKRYHPDKQFGGELGPFKEMLEEVFQHITRAYRILTDEERRREYDAEVGVRDADGAGVGETSTAAESADAPSQTEDDRGKGDGQKQEAASRLLVNRARKYRDRGQLDDAADEYRKAVSLNRRLETALEAAQMLVDADLRLEDATVFARAALKLDESSAQGYFLLGRSYEAREMVEQAVEAYRRAVQLDDHQEAERRLGRLESRGETS